MNCTSPSNCECDTLCVFSAVSTLLFISTACYLMCYCCLENRSRNSTRVVLYSNDQDHTLTNCIPPSYDTVQESPPPSYD